MGKSTCHRSDDQGLSPKTYVIFNETTNPTELYSAIHLHDTAHKITNTQVHTYTHICVPNTHSIISK